MSFMQTAVQIAAQTLFVIDPDDKRRNAVTCLLAQAYTALPFACLNELGQRWPKSGCIILAAEDELLLQCRETMLSMDVCLPIVCYHERPSVEDIFAAAQCGANGYFAWPTTLSTMLACIGPTCARFEADRESHVRKQHARRLINRLSRREYQVLVHFLQGLCSKSSARRLGISARTIELHRANVTTKLEARSLLAAAAIALQAGMRLSDEELRAA